MRLLRWTLVALAIASAAASYLVQTDITTITNLSCQGEMYDDIRIEDDVGHFSNSSRIHVEWNYAVISVTIHGTPPCHLSVYQRCVIDGPASVNETISAQQNITAANPYAADEFRTDCKVVQVTLNATNAGLLTSS